MPRTPIEARAPAGTRRRGGLHLGFAGIVSLGGGTFLGLGIVASFRARRERLVPEAARRGIPDSGRS